MYNYDINSKSGDLRFSPLDVASFTEYCTRNNIKLHAGDTGPEEGFYRNNNMQYEARYQGINSTNTYDITSMSIPVFRQHRGEGGKHHISCVGQALVLPGPLLNSEVRRCFTDTGYSGNAQFSGFLVNKVRALKDEKRPEFSINQDFDLIELKKNQSGLYIPLDTAPEEPVIWTRLQFNNPHLKAHLLVLAFILPPYYAKANKPETPTHEYIYGNLASWLRQYPNPISTAIFKTFEKSQEYAYNN